MKNGKFFRLFSSIFVLEKKKSKQNINFHLFCIINVTWRRELRTSSAIPLLAVLWDNREILKKDFSRCTDRDFSQDHAVSISASLCLMENVYNDRLHTINHNVLLMSRINDEKTLDWEKINFIGIVEGVYT